MSLFENPDVWKIFLTSSVVAALTSAILGFVLNRWFFSFQFKKKHEAGFIQGRAQLYSKLFFWLQVWEFTDNSNELSWKQFTDVDALLSTSLHLVSAEIQNKWLQVHTYVLDENEEGTTRTIRELSKIVMNEFNDKIIPKYECYVGKNIQRLTI